MVAADDVGEGDDDDEAVGSEAEDDSGPGWVGRCVGVVPLE